MTQITYHHVTDSRHPVINLTFGVTGIPRALMEVAEDLELLNFPATNAVVAYRAGKMVGMFRYVMKRRGLVARGTCVHPAFRGKGIATRLWTLALGRTKPSSVTVWTGSFAGHSLAKSIAKTNTHIRWNID